MDGSFSWKVVGILSCLYIYLLNRYLPDRFNKAFPYPAFDVKDLHLVDNGVIKHLFPELAENDWQILIGHFLGVDHCGHR